MTPSKYVLVYGAGGHGLVVAQAALASGATVEYVFDDAPQKWGSQLLRVPVGQYDLNRYPAIPLVLALGDNAQRRVVASQVAHPFGTVCAASAEVAGLAQVGEGSQVLSRAVIGVEAQVGRHTIVNTGVIVEHHVVVADFVHLAPGAVLCGGCHVGEGTVVGPGVVIVKGKRVGKGCLLAAGTVVTEDVPDGMRVQGIPGRAMPLEGQSWDWA